MKKRLFLVYRFSTLILPILCISIGNSYNNSVNILLRLPEPKIILEAKKELTLDPETSQKLAKLHTKDPSGVGKKLLKNGFKKLLPKLGGFVALYGGYADYSNNDGVVSFPLLHNEPKIYLAITNKLNILNVFGETIAHRSFEKDASSELYLFERKENGDKTLYWEVSKQDIPENRKINPIAVVLLTKPKNIVVPTGDFMTTDNINLVAPSIYVVGNLDNAKTLLNFMDMRKYFEQIDWQKKIEEDTNVQRLMKNL